jgi:hypothetical protein
MGFLLGLAVGAVVVVVVPAAFRWVRKQVTDAGTHV